MWGGIRVRITALAAIAVVIVLAGTAVVLLATQRQLLTDNLDETLTTQARELARSLDDGITTNPLAPRGDDDAIAQIATTGGDVVAATANFSFQPALSPPPRNVDSRLRTARLLTGEPSFRVASRRAGDHIVHVASPTDDIDESIAALRLALAATIPIVTVMLAAVIWWLVGRTLRPVESIRHEVATITGQNLDRRVPAPASNDEIRRLALTMNAMLDRVEHATRSQQRFVADASHELRSPLTRIRSELEVDLAHPDTADAEATRRSALDEVERMQRLVEDLLVLARHDNGPMIITVARVLVDLDDVVLQEVHRRQPATSIGIDSGGVSAAQVKGDAGQLARLVRNLLDNAIRHARTTVTVNLGEHAEMAILTITDDGPGIPPEHHERVFERFTRLDYARATEDGGTGLGLAIARAITVRHHGTIRIDADYRPGARFVVQLPREDVHNG
jgi:signal transduction histidine kinase